MPQSPFSVGGVIGGSFMAPRVFQNNRITKMFGTELPIIQGGMVHNSGAKLAAAVSEAGGLGLIGAGSMRPALFAEHINKARQLTKRPFGVNIPLLYDHSAECVEVALAEGVKIFFTSAGSPKKVAAALSDEKFTFVHVVSSPTLARKCEDAGCDAIVCEGFEAGGHNGRDEITTMVLVPECTAAVSIPVIAAGGIATGAQMAAALALGAEAVQLGSRFAASVESSGHAKFKQAVVDADARATRLVLKKHVPVRMLKNAFRDRITAMEDECATVAELKAELGTGRARRGMAEGDLDEGELEIGQVSGLINEVLPVATIVANIMAEYQATVARLQSN
ncbi:MAG: enoyl-[acyl-carrier protein] reductase II [Candidatus Krumholzibacteriia bacterium]|jgi:enoyl-[acyl-carrier protein] reductase II